MPTTIQASNSFATLYRAGRLAEKGCKSAPTDQIKRSLSVFGEVDVDAYIRTRSLPKHPMENSQSECGKRVQIVISLNVEPAQKVLYFSFSHWKPQPIIRLDRIGESSFDLGTNRCDWISQRSSLPSESAMNWTKP